jgi:diphthine-ammonia ligase
MRALPILNKQNKKKGDYSMGEKVFVSWNGDKNSFLAMLKARERGLEVHCLLAFSGQEGTRASHGVSEELLRSQARALGFPLYRERVAWNNYEDVFKRALKRLKKEGVSGGVFADINLPGHRQRVEKICRDLGVTAHFPLEGMAEKKVIEELLDRGSQLLVVALQEDGLSRQWLGKMIDKKFVAACRMAGIGSGGEGGEFQTFVVGGPLFQKSLELVQIGWWLESKTYTLELCEAYQCVRETVAMSGSRIN